jgi:hypothetical protein
VKLAVSRGAGEPNAQESNPGFRDLTKHGEPLGLLPVQIHGNEDRIEFSCSLSNDFVWSPGEAKVGYVNGIVREPPEDKDGFRWDVLVK